MLEKEPEAISFSPDSEWVDPLVIIEPLLNHRWAVGLIALSAFLLSILYSFYATPIYEAKSSLIIRQNVSENVLQEKETPKPGWVEPRNELNTTARIVTSQTLLRELVKQLIDRGYLKKDLQKLDYPNLPAEKKAQVVQALATRLLKDIKTTNPKETSIIEITYQSEDPALTRDVVNGLAEQVVEYHRTERMLFSKDSLAYLNEQLEEARKHVEAAETKLYEYRQQHNIFEADRDKELIAERRSRVEEKLAEIQGQRAGLESKISQFEDLLRRQDYLKYTLLMPENPILMDLKEELVKTEVDYRKLQIKYGDKHPEVEKDGWEIGILRQKFDQELKSMLIQLNFNLNVIKSQETFWRNRLAETEKSAVNSTKKDIELVVLDRDANSAREAYRTLLAAVKEVTVNTSSAGNNVIYVHEKSLLPKDPVRPKMSLNAVVGLVLGIMLGGAYAYGREYLDQTIRHAEDVRKAVNLSVLCTIPLDSAKINQNHAKTDPAETKQRLLLVSKRPKSLFSESIFALRSQLSIKLPQDSPKIILVTSCAPQEGKSLIASNLALSFAMNGQKTLILDADLHHPVVHKIFNLEKNQAGLYDLIVDALTPPWSALNLKSLSLSDIQHLIQRKQWSGTLRIAWNSLPLELDISYQEGRPAGSNFKVWKEAAGHPHRFPSPKDLSWSLDPSAIAHLDSPQDSTAQALDFIRQYPSLDRSAYFADLVLRKYIQTTEHKNLHALTAGNNPKNPSEILGSEQMRFLIKLLKERYDRIILDTPPARPLSDVSLLAPFIDYVLWICRAGEIHRNNFVRSVQQIQQVQPNILGVVINAVDLQRDRYYYYGYYGYPYYGDHYQRYYESEDQEPGETAGAEEKGEIHAPEVDS